jgi:hypothetical protein
MTSEQLSSPQYFVKSDSGTANAIVSAPNKKRSNRPLFGHLQSSDDGVALALPATLRLTGSEEKYNIWGFHQLDRDPENTRYCV